MAKKTLVLVLTATLVSLPSFSGENTKKSKVERNNTWQASEIYTIVKSNAPDIIHLGGNVIPKTTVNLTAQMPGDVSFVAGSEGDYFRAGEALVTLDKKSLLAKRKQAQTQLASANAGYRNAQMQYEHERVNPNSQSNSMLGGAPALFSMFTDPARSMMGQGSPRVERRSNLYSRGIAIETAFNSIEKAKAAIRELDEAIENSVSYAPFDGVILKKMVEKGDIVQPGMPLVSFANIKYLQVRTDVPTRLLNTIKQKRKVLAQLDGESKPIVVQLDRIFPMADVGGHTTTVKFDLPVGVGAHPGMYAKIIIADPETSETKLPVIPSSSILWRSSLPSVYKIGKNGRLKLRLIRVGEADAQGMVSVISGVYPGDRILLRPTTNSKSSR